MRVPSACDAPPRPRPGGASSCAGTQSGRPSARLTTSACSATAGRYGIPSFEYTNISPTIHGGGEVLPSQAREVLRTRKPYTGCNALAPDAVEFVADTDTLLTMCSCSASSSQPY